MKKFLRLSSYESFAYRCDPALLLNTRMHEFLSLYKHFSQPGGAADIDGSIGVGDHLLAVNKSEAEGLRTLVLYSVITLNQ